ncbi:hypothetical protein FACS1894110_23750 [Spirochaetia bacterium]|nr:hypothetical protein FACS1894110_23750 [Spirochaetia bacterium]
MKLLSIKEVKRMIGGSSTQWLNRQILDGKLEAIYIAKKPKFYACQVEAFIQENAQNYKTILEGQARNKGGEVRA